MDKESYPDKHQKKLYYETIPNPKTEHFFIF
jgi:hypothetical protein